MSEVRKLPVYEFYPNTYLNRRLRKGCIMNFTNTPTPEEVSCLLQNAALRDAIEPFFENDTFCDIDFFEMPTEVENRYLESMLAWEQAPVLPVGRWFNPSIILEPVCNLSEEQLREELWAVVERLYEGRVVLDFTDHLSDRELYNLIRREILPTPVKRVDLPDNYFHWDCSVAGRAPEFSADDWYPEAVAESLIWLTYYADNAERSEWENEYCIDLPPCEIPPYPRAMPSAPV